MLEIYSAEQKPVDRIHAECAKFEAELAGEIAKEKFSPNSTGRHNHDRLRRWYRELRGRDLFGAPSSPLAERRLKSAPTPWEDFAERVFGAREHQ